MNKIYPILFGILLIYCGYNETIVDPNLKKLNNTWFRISYSNGQLYTDSTESFEILRFENKNMHQYLKYDNYVEYYKWHFDVWNDSIFKTYDNVNFWLCGAFYYHDDTLIIERTNFKALFLPCATQGPPVWWPDSTVIINMDSLNNSLIL
jgi:hypothetical protein